MIVHYGTVKQGELNVDSVCDLVIDDERRNRVSANHSATHLLNEALRQRLGSHVIQRGSLNDEKRLRLDFSHTGTLSEADIDQVENCVNSYIKQDSRVKTQLMTTADAKALGAQAVFGEKYGDEVLVVSMGKQANSGKGLNQDDFSIELCGGTHVERTSEIGDFVIVAEKASSSGVRRVEALTGQAATLLKEDKLRLQGMLSLALKNPLVEAATKLLEEDKLRLQGMPSAATKLLEEDKLRSKVILRLAALKNPSYDPLKALKNSLDENKSLWQLYIKDIESQIKSNINIKSPLDEKIRRALKLQSSSPTTSFINMSKEQINKKLDIPRFISALHAENKKLRRVIKNQNSKGNSPETQEIKLWHTNIGKRLFHFIETSAEGKALGDLIDEAKGKHSEKPFIILAVSRNNDKWQLACGVNQDGSLSAADIIKVAVQALGGRGGGGRANFARGGAPIKDSVTAEMAKQAAIKYIREKKST